MTTPATPPTPAADPLADILTDDNERDFPRFTRVIRSLAARLASAEQARTDAEARLAKVATVIDVAHNKVIELQSKLAAKALTGKLPTAFYAHEIRTAVAMDEVTAMLRQALAAALGTAADAAGDEGAGREKR